MVGIASDGSSLVGQGLGKGAKNRFCTFWHGVKLSMLEWICIKSFVNQGYDYQLYAYPEVRSKCHFPSGILIRPAEEILPRDQMFYFQGSPSAFSNLFRYKLLSQTDAWWVDTDVYCPGRPIPNVDYCWAEEEPGKINGAILKLGNDGRLSGTLYEAALVRSSTITRWGQLGPNLLTEYLTPEKSLSHFGTQQSLYAIHWLEAYYYWLPEFYAEVLSRTDKSVFHHFWNSILVRFIGMDGNEYPPEGSFMASIWNCDTPRHMAPDTAGDIRFRIRKYLSQNWVQEECARRRISLRSPI